MKRYDDAIDMLKFYNNINTRNYMKREDDAYNEQMELLKRAGREYIKKRWRSFHPKTLKYLETNGYVNATRNLNSKPVYDTYDIEILEYSVGLFKESAAVNIPDKKDSAYPSFLIDDQLLQQAGDLLSPDNPFNSADFTPIAINALMKRQAALAFSKIILITHKPQQL